jgi:hypothetical protein
MHYTFPGTRPWYRLSHLESSLDTFDKYYREFCRQLGQHSIGH